LIGLTKRKGSDKVEIDKIVFGKVYHRLTDDDIINMKSYCAEADVILKQVGE
jgi:hypothetical protein